MIVEVQLKLFHIPISLSENYRYLMIVVSREGLLGKQEFHFSTRPIFNFGKEEIYIGESFKIESANKESFLRFDILGESISTRKLALLSSQQMFTGDLADPRHTLVFKIGPKVKIRILYDLNGELHTVVHRTKTKQEESMELKNPSILQSLALTKKTVESVTCLRRLNDDICYLLNRKAFSKDLLSLIILTLVLSWPRVSIFVMGLSLCLPITQRKLRLFIGKKTGQYFYKAKDFAEIQKNGHFMYHNQEKMYSAAISMKELLLKKNRNKLQLIFTLLPFIFFGLLIISFLPFALILWMVLVYAFVAKYFSSLFESVGISKSSKPLSYFLQQNSQSEKDIFGYEVQRWFIIKGFVGDNFLENKKVLWNHDRESKLKLRHIVLGNRWKWNGEWEIVFNNCDSDGWQYAHSFADNFTNKQYPTSLVRRRMWKRSCILDSNNNNNRNSIEMSPCNANMSSNSTLSDQ